MAVRKDDFKYRQLERLPSRKDYQPEGVSNR